MIKHVFILTELKIHKGTDPGAARMMNLAKALASEGINVYICSSKNRNAVGIDKMVEVHSRIFLIGQDNEKKISKLRKILFLSINVLYLLPYIRKVQQIAHKMSGQKVFYIYPQPAIAIDLLSIIYLKYLCRHKIFCDINELRRAALHNITFSKSLFKGSYQTLDYCFSYFKFHIAERLTKYYDGLIVISNNIEQYFRKYNRNMLKIPILCDISMYSGNKIKNYDKIDNFKIGFTGLISLKKEGFDAFYKALSIVKSKINNIELHLYGPLYKTEKSLLLKEMPDRLGLKQNIFYHGIVERDFLMKELEKCHLLVLPRPFNLQTKYGFSTKLSEYLVSGVPTLVTNVSDNGIYLKDGWNGFIVEPGNEEKMAEKILHIIRNYNCTEMQAIATNSFLTAKKHFYFKNYGKEIAIFLFNN